jgi:hypothetical protein
MPVPGSILKKLGPEFSPLNPNVSCPPVIWWKKKTKRNKNFVSIFILPSYYKDLENNYKKL